MVSAKKKYNWGKISVLMAVYNEQDSIDESIQSILNQTLDAWELIIIDDCSNDKTPEILKKYAEQYPNKIYVYQNIINRGLSYSLNKGSKFCKYKYIARIDADDLCKPHRFQRQIDFLEAHEKIALVSGAIEYIDDFGVLLGRTYPITALAKIRKKILRGSNVIVHPAVMMRAEAFRNCGGYCDGLPIIEDIHLWKKFLRRGYNLSILPEVMISYRISGKAISNYTKTQRKIYLMDEILKYDDPSVYLIESFKKEFVRNEVSTLSSVNRKQQILKTMHCRISRLSYRLKISEKLLERTICYIQNFLP